MTQENAILQALLNGDSLTALDALDRFKCFRLAARVNSLRKMGHAIESDIVLLNSTKRVSRYFMRPRLTLAA